MMSDNVREQLFRKLKEENCFWSYDVSKMKSISDEALIEHVMLYLDIEDITQLFALFGYKKVKRVWLDRVAPQGEMFRPFNIFYAWYYFGAMKMEAMLRRSKFRDYHDTYSILKEGIDIQKMIDAALEHSDHKLRTRGLLAMQTNGSRFIKEKSFEELLPVYDVSPYDIQEYIKQKLLEKKQ